MRTVRINGRWELLLPDHRADVHEQHPRWEEARLDSMAANIRPGMVVYDVGAEEGDLTALYRSWVGPEGTVVPIEPQPAYWPSIRACLTMNGWAVPQGGLVGFASDVTDLTPPACDIEGALYPCSGLWPPCSEGEIAPAFGFRHVHETAAITPRITIDDLAVILGGAPDVLTIDVEGAELVVLRGAEMVVSEARPLIWVSVHPELMFLHQGQYEAEVHSWLGAHNYAIEHLAFDHEHHYFAWPAERSSRRVHKPGSPGATGTRVVAR